MPLYPLPPLAAMAGFVFILVNRAHALGGLAVAAGIGALRHADLPVPRPSAAAMAFRAKLNKFCNANALPHV